ncbi:MAG: dihydroorotate dehydrogenase electron transfer subunit [Bacteroidales bacterium]|nr:dihydroorotate dehydrogenase electron transfer subunit [Candidatus Physcocola equi]
MKKHIIDFEVSSNEEVGNNAILMKLHCPTPLPEIKPGQFVEVRIDNEPNVFLRRPISINYIDKKANEMWLLVQKVGKGTNKLGTLQKGDTLNCVVPLGNGFDTKAAQGKKVLLVGGGVGVAPMLMLGSTLKEEGTEPTFLLGARTKNMLLEKELFEQTGRLLVTTEDGSLGEKGFVTNHSVLSNEKFDKIYVCGPTPMMKAVAGYAKKAGIDCEVSLENKMACGLGACLCCVTETQEGHKCVCTDGPVFNINELTWQI